MADHLPTGTRRNMPRTNRSRAAPQITVPTPDPENHLASERPRIDGPSAREMAQRKYPRTGRRELRVIPASLISQWKEMFKSQSRVKCPNSCCWLQFPSVYSLKQHYERCQGAGLSSRLRFSCTFCEAVFISKSQLQKHLIWNHPDLGGNREKRPQQPAFCRGAKERAAEKLQPRRSKHTKLQKPPEENGKETPGVRRGDTSNEDPERMKHRRKQKTPKKFTGEQPSVSGTFGLKGLGKVDDKSWGRRVRPVCVRTKEVMKRRDGPSIRRDHAVPAAGSLDDACLRHGNKRGVVTCPNCVSVTRKTMAGLKKHMDVCEQEALRCQHCRKQFKSKAGLNYHTMAEHVNKSSSPDDTPRDEQKERERLRRVLKQMGKLRCPKEDCSASFSSLMGYQYHTQRCGRQQTAGDRLRFSCPYCSREYQSKAGRDYHVRSEHCQLQAPTEPTQAVVEAELEDIERTPSGRIRRQSAQVAIFHLQEIAEDELAKDGGRRRMREDLVPDSKRLNYLRPGLPTFNPQLLDSWKSRVKENGFICCPNNCCEAIYSSVSGLKAHLANCTKGAHSVGKYRCLLCQKEFSSESGVKYHILKAHSQNWFRASAVSSPLKRKSPSSICPGNASETGATDKKQRKKPKEKPPASTPATSAPQTKEAPSLIKIPPKKTSKPASAHSLGLKATLRKGLPTKRGK
ncbi:zinc finger protein 512B isoform X2 [Spea bombifrons]|uniref:zinc finger protein 512B isoform X2 n=1 Tax=Spea bombifrons TaxID=233779 RepID=UPI00234A52A0|nr:zinc finger protein 512B isoform X2 [Spea bombifrons]